MELHLSFSKHLYVVTCVEFCVFHCKARYDNEVCLVAFGLTTLQAGLVSGLSFCTTSGLLHRGEFNSHKEPWQDDEATDLQPQKKKKELGEDSLNSFRLPSHSCSRLV